LDGRRVGFFFHHHIRTVQKKQKKAKTVETDVAGLMNWNYSLLRLTSVEGVGCIDEPPAQPQITPGTWVGTGVCFNVAADGKTLTEVGSTCDGNAAFDSNLDGLNNDLNECGVEAECDGVGWDIVNGQFSCTGELGSLAIGTFTSATTATGKAFEGEGGVGDYCVGPWEARAEP